jgi:hypothetical protein
MENKGAEGVTHMEQRSTWGNAVGNTSRKKNKLPFRGFQKETDDMNESQRKGVQVWNEMVTRLIEVGEMKDK